MIISWELSNIISNVHLKSIFISWIESFHFGPVVSNHGNLYNKLPALMLGRYGVPHAKVNITDQEGDG